MRSRPLTGGNRGQAHSLEAITASMLLVASLLFALQVTAVTPLTASTSSQHIENQQQAVGTGLLSSMDETDALEPAVLYWNESEDGQQFIGAREDGYPQGGPPNEFGAALDDTFVEQGIAMNVKVQYVSAGGTRRTEPMVDMGTPSAHAASASTTVTLFDDDRIRDAAGEPTGPTLAEVESDSDREFYAPDVVAGPMYNVVVVEVIVWRM